MKDGCRHWRSYMYLHWLKLGGVGEVEISQAGWSWRLSKSCQAFFLQMQGIRQDLDLKNRLYFMMLDSEPNVKCACKHTHMPHTDLHKLYSWNIVVLVSDTHNTVGFHPNTGKNLSKGSLDISSLSCLLGDWKTWLQTQAVETQSSSNPRLVIYK